MGQGPFRQAIMYDYNNKNNENQVKETDPAGSQNWVFPATITMLLLLKTSSCASCTERRERFRIHLGKLQYNLVLDERA